MPLEPLAPLAPLQPLDSGVTLHSLQPLVVPRFQPSFVYTGAPAFGNGTGGDPFAGSGIGLGDPFAPAQGPTMGGNFPSSCDPSTDPFCGGCDPQTDPFCGGGGLGEGGGVVNVSFNPVRPGSALGNFLSGGGACGCSFFDVTCWFLCYAERITILILGLIAIVGGVYLLKPDSVIAAPARAVKRAIAA